MAFDDFLSERRKLMAGIVRRSFQTLRKAALMNEILIFESGDHPVQVRLTGDTVWLSQSQMAELFDVQKAAVSKHLKNIFNSGELDAMATVSKMETVQ